MTVQVQLLERRIGLVEDTLHAIDDWLAQHKRDRTQRDRVATMRTARRDAKAALRKLRRLRSRA